MRVSSTPLNSYSRGLGHRGSPLTLISWTEGPRALWVSDFQPLYTGASGTVVFSTHNLRTEGFGHFNCSIEPYEPKTADEMSPLPRGTFWLLEARLLSSPLPAYKCRPTDPPCLAPRCSPTGAFPRGVDADDGWSFPPPPYSLHPPATECPPPPVHLGALPP